MNYIIILNWKNYHETIKCIESVLTLKYEPFNVVICDNNSGDDSLQHIKVWLNERGYIKNYLLQESEITTSEFDRTPNSVFLIQNLENYGYAGGNNRGVIFALQDVDCEFVWILNNDTRVDDSALRSMVVKMRADANIGICGSLLIFDSARDKVQGVGGKFDKYFCISEHVYENREVEEILKIDDKDFVIDYVIGASMLVRRELFDKIGLMFEDYFLYYEEIDFCLRAHMQGYKIGVAKESFVYHKVGLSIGQGKSIFADYLSVKNRLIVSRRFYPKSYLFVWLSLSGVAFNRLRRKEWRKMSYIIKAFFWDAWIILFKYKAI
ncbi:glycosyltransferase family 2 protein [Enterobacteriaceae bacterium YMB-R22]|uniref:glycosyltransferase family 2 protein n=1 Tax=Tenebrionicola larvae TaxID=2815733 RepID=UPI0020113D7B|nr:glycosyltransferase family 2 protein [Tenebrionicola larvae]MBV4412035.1 glycosyltransferase family 2 protein [Tenebrionicola larvae]